MKQKATGWQKVRVVDGRKISLEQVINLEVFTLFNWDPERLTLMLARQESYGSRNS